jgi:hypothetical protein
MMTAQNPRLRSGRDERGYTITNKLPSQAFRDFNRYYHCDYPQAAVVESGTLVSTRQMNSTDCKGGVIVPGECFIACSTKGTTCLKVRHGKRIWSIPISSKLEFALIPNEDRDNTNVLGKQWEMVFTDVADVTRLPILPKVLYVRDNCCDHKKRQVARGTQLYNVTLLKKKEKCGVECVSCDGTSYTFLEGEPVNFSSRQVDTKVSLPWLLKVLQFPQKARVFISSEAEGMQEIQNHSEITFLDKEDQTYVLVKKVGDTKNTMYIQEDCDVKVAAVTVEGCKEYEHILRDRTIRTVTADETKRSDTPDQVRTRLPSHSSGNEYVPLGNIRASLNKDPKQTSLSLEEWTNTSHTYQNYKPQNAPDYYNVFAESGEFILLKKQDNSKEPVYETLEDVMPNLQHKDEDENPTGKSTAKEDSLLQSGKKQISLSDQPSEILLRFHISGAVAKDWSKLATFLGLDYSVSEQIREDYKSAEEKSFTVLVYWLQGKGTNSEPKTWEVLLQKLELLGRKELSSEIRDMITNGTLDDLCHK